MKYFRSSVIGLNVSRDRIFPAKTGEYPRISVSQFLNCAHCVKDLKNSKHNSLHLGRTYARIFVLGHYLFLVAHSEQTMSADKYPSILFFAPNGGYCLFKQ